MTALGPRTLDFDSRRPKDAFFFLRFRYNTAPEVRDASCIRRLFDKRAALMATKGPWCLPSTGAINKIND